MKLAKNLQTIWIRKDALQQKNSSLAIGDVCVRTGLMGPFAVRGLYLTQGVFVEYKAVRTMTVRLKRKGKK